MKLNLRAIGILLIGLSTFISFILAVTVDMSHYELGALVNYFWPFFIGVLTIILFLVITVITKRHFYWKLGIVICCLYNLYIGLALHLEKEYWPLVLF